MWVKTAGAGLKPAPAKQIKTMKPKTLLFLCLFISASFLMQGQTSFGYDASGNRTSRRTIVLTTLSSAPQGAPQQSKAKKQDKNSEEEEILTQNEESEVLETESLESPEIPESRDVPETVYSDRLEESDVKIYPNPTQGALAVEILKKNPKTRYGIHVYTMSGATIFEQTNVGDYTPIDLSKHPKGMYLLRISAGDTFVTWKIVKD